MQKFKMLVLTDHSNHSQENSLYALVRAMRQHPRCEYIDVATRGLKENDLFFKKRVLRSLHVSRATEHFNYQADGGSFRKGLRLETIRNYDVIWLRMPPPLTSEFLGFLGQSAKGQLIINSPKGIHETGTKEFLVNFQEFCPPMKICRSVEDIVSFKNNFPIVLKPFREYGGKGIVKIDGDTAWEGNNEMSFTHFIEKIKNEDIGYLGVKFLKNVGKGDKRIIVVNGKILGASLRLPPKDSWICNVAMGGNAVPTQVDQDEIEIVEGINPALSEMGIVMYGVDTLVGDNGKRILSEINATSIGGLPQIAEQTGKPLVKEAVALIWQYITEKIIEKNAITN